MQGKGGPWLSPSRRAHSSLALRNSVSDKQLLSLDVPAVELADSDSLFLECSGLLVHYKEAQPQVSRPGTWEGRVMCKYCACQPVAVCCSEVVQSHAAHGPCTAPCILLCRFGQECRALCTSHKDAEHCNISLGCATCNIRLVRLIAAFLVAAEIATCSWRSHPAHTWLWRR